MTPKRKEVRTRHMINISGELYERIEAYANAHNPPIAITKALDELTARNKLAEHVHRALVELDAVAHMVAQDEVMKRRGLESLATYRLSIMPYLERPGL